MMERSHGNGKIELADCLSFTQEPSILLAETPCDLIRKRQNADASQEPLESFFSPSWLK